MYPLFEIIALVVFKMVLVANCLPVGNGKWTNPCGSTLTPFPLPPLPPQIDVMSDIVLRLKEGIQITSQLKQKYVAQRVVSQSKIRYLEDVHLSGLPVLHVTDDIISSAIQNSTKAHLTTYEQLSNAAIFLEQVNNDEANSGNTDFINDIIQTESKLYNIMCHIQIATDQSGVVIEIYQSRDIMSNAIRTIQGITDRTDRDYIIVKDILKILQSTLVIYQAITAKSS